VQRVSQSNPTKFAYGTLSHGAIADALVHRIGPKAGWVNPILLHEAGQLFHGRQHFGAMPHAPIHCVF